MNEQIIKYLPYILGFLLLIFLFIFIIFLIHQVKLHTFKGTTLEDIESFRNNNKFSWNYVNFKVIKLSEKKFIVVKTKWYYLPNHYSRKANKIISKYYYQNIPFSLDGKTYIITTSSMNDDNNEFTYYYN